MNLARARTTVFAMSTLIALSSACGGPQQPDQRLDESDCPGVSAALSDQALSVAAACLLVEASAASAAQCRTVAGFAAEVSPATLELLARCVLAASDREDGAWLADAMGAVVADDARLHAFASAVGSSEFDPMWHTNTFATALSDNTQDALGRSLAELDEAARLRIVSIALGYGLDTLAAHAGIYVDQLEDDDPGVRAFAVARADSGEALDETDRWALAASGTWSAAELLSCYRGEQPGCEDWDGESPLALMAEVDVASGHASAPQQAIRLLRTGELDEDSVEGITTYIGSEDGGRTMLNSLMLDLTASSVAVEQRAAIARAATGPMCEFQIVGATLVRVPNSDPERLTDPSSPWPTFIAACLERHWEADDMMAALSTGSWLGVPPALHETVLDELERSTAGSTCADYLTMAEDAYSLGLGIPMRGLAWTIGARLAGEPCVASFDEAVRRALADPDGHPESRIAAAAWLLDRGDDSGCRQIDEIMRWHDEEVDAGPGEWAEVAAEALRGRCIL